MSQKENLIIILVVLFTTCLFLLGVFFFILVNKYRKNLERRQREALSNLIIGQDNERQRIARDLHDEMGPELSNVIFSLDGIKSSHPEVLETVEKSKNELKAAIKRLRNISHDLMSLSLIRYGLTDAIREMVDRQSQSEIRIHYDSDATGKEMNDAVKSHLFRIAQELLYNTQKHSQATEVQIGLHLDKVKNQLLFTYSDNGIGNQGNKETMGIGLKNIHTRVDLMQGTIEISMDKGYQCTIMVGLNA
ncbi:MAG: two-component sensor histidine kinase [Chitinophagaceae bacterium]|nr:two-component sensor histidine kinase [Chitinophagaceae bacterium]